jgi:HTH-type transcriptional regulator / antitoxin HigA
MPNTTGSTPRPSRTVEVFPIRSEDDLGRALAEIDALLDVEHPTDVERDRLEVLTTLAEAFEDKHHPIGPPNAIEAIRFRLDQLGFHTPATQAKTLARLLGSRSRAYEILHGKRGLSAQMVTKIWRRWDVPLESLVRGMTVRNRSTVRGRANRSNQVPRRTGSS